jgi:small ligand-binding sensory domain FIST
MPFAAALSTCPDTETALAEVLQRARGSFAGTADLALLFYAPDHQDALAASASSLLRQIDSRWMIGCPGETIIGGDREIEQEPALALWLGRWGGAIRGTPFYLSMEQTSEGHSLLGWPDEIAEAQPTEALILTLGDPFSFPVEDYLRQLNRDKPGLAVVGGMASGAQQPGQNRLLFNDRAVDSGAVSILLQGPLGFRSTVSQGCRPIGKPLVITRAEENRIFELGGKPAPARLQELWQELEPRDRELVQQGLHVGRVINEYQSTFRRGDFLVRNVLGMDRASGALVIGDRVRVGQTVQLHVRDAQTADEDLRLLLQQAAQEKSAHAAGALLFSCNGRGSRLFDQPHHDAQAVQQVLGPLPLAGFFAMGELGPIGGQNFIHGFTASLALFDDL